MSEQPDRLGTCDNYADWKHHQTSLCVNWKPVPAAPVPQDWCDTCHAPQMVMPDGEHRCGQPTVPQSGGEATLVSKQLVLDWLTGYAGPEEPEFFGKFLDKLQLRIRQEGSPAPETLMDAVAMVDDEVLWKFEQLLYLLGDTPPPPYIYAVNRINNFLSWLASVPQPKEAKKQDKSNGSN